ncbi:MAG TPA: GAF domain-containing protein, partial [Tepidisphaeraceae bacterium]|nr:GAF domain-containing protein [Tepidisphaeraceae bacterium]
MAHPLAFSVLIVALTCAAVLFFLRRAESRRVARHLEALESLSETSADPIASEIIERLPKSARHLLNVSISIVGLLDEEGKILTLAASSGIDLPAERPTFNLDDLPNARLCLQTHEVIATDQVRGDSAAVDAPLAARLGLASILHIPLMVAGRPLGVMLVGDRFPRKFS